MLTLRLHLDTAHRKRTEGLSALQISEMVGAIEEAWKTKNKTKSGGGKMKKALIICKTRKTAVKRAAWACKIVKVEGGYMAFESWDDYKVWKNQK